VEISEKMKTFLIKVHNTPHISQDQLLLDNIHILIGFSYQDFNIYTKQGRDGRDASDRGKSIIDSLLKNTL